MRIQFFVCRIVPKKTQAGPLCTQNALFLLKFKGDTSVQKPFGLPSTFASLKICFIARREHTYSSCFSDLVFRKSELLSRPIRSESIETYKAANRNQANRLS